MKNYNFSETLSTFSTDGPITKELNRVNNNYFISEWYSKPSGEIMYISGLELTKQELISLKNTLDNLNLE